MPPTPPPVPYERRHPMLIRNRIWLAIGATVMAALYLLSWILPLLFSGGSEDEDDDFRTGEPVPQIVVDDGG